MRTYRVRVQCPDCEEFYVENRLRPPKRLRKKTCPSCKNKKSESNIKLSTPLGGKEDKSCANCKYFYHNKDMGSTRFYRECLKGYKARVDEELLSDLVYSEDLCEEWREK